MNLTVDADRDHGPHAMWCWPCAAMWYSYSGMVYANPDAVTTTYGYDAFGARVYQIVATTSTSTYPFKFFSVSSTTKSSTNCNFYRIFL